jgi:uncharacterized protein (DUF736 family)
MKLTLGRFFKNSYAELNGNINGLGMKSTSITFMPATSREGKPYSKLIADPLGEAYEIGFAFEKQKQDMVFYSVILESPVFNAPIHAVMFPDRARENFFNLVWERPAQYNFELDADGAKQRRYVGATAAP